jgi:hypothetical protein
MSGLIDQVRRGLRDRWSTWAPGWSPTSPDEVAARIAAAVPGVVAADRSTVSLWDAGAQRLSTVATHGWPTELEPLIEELSVRPSDTPELADMLTDARPRCRPPNG